MGSQDEQFMRLWTEAAPGVSAFVHSVVPDFHRAKDILQDVAVVLFQKFDQYDPSRPFIAWAMGFAKYRILAERRDEARNCITYHADIVDSLAFSAASMQPELEREQVALRECLRRVAGRSLKLLKMRYVEELKPGEIAKREGMNPSALRVALFRTRETLAKCIKHRLALADG